jgi:hypothetical protein
LLKCGFRPRSPVSKIKNILRDAKFKEGRNMKQLAILLFLLLSLNANAFLDTSTCDKPTQEAEQTFLAFHLYSLGMIKGPAQSFKSDTDGAISSGQVWDFDAEKDVPFTCSRLKAKIDEDLTKLKVAIKSLSDLNGYGTESIDSVAFMSATYCEDTIMDTVNCQEDPDTFEFMFPAEVAKLLLDEFNKK